jgi:pSer/pThr/pTyr-binding forkhead associated (FHA) protein
MKHKLSDSLQFLSKEYVTLTAQSSSSNFADNPLIEASTEFDKSLPSLRLEPDSEEAEHHLPESIIIKQFPFFIGRKLSVNERTPSLKVHLKIRDSHPFQISRVHIVVQKLQDDQFLVRDLDSNLGTIVDGKAIGRKFSDDSFQLPKQGASITLGGVRSPYKFRVTPI